MKTKYNLIEIILKATKVFLSCYKKFFIQIKEENQDEYGNIYILFKR